MWLSPSTMSHSACTNCSASIARSIAVTTIKSASGSALGLPAGHPAKWWRSLVHRVPDVGGPGPPGFAFRGRADPESPERNRRIQERDGENPDGDEREPRLAGK